MTDVHQCAVYARVSTDMQGDSLQNQVDYAKEYVRRLGDGYRLDEACVYTDFDQSGYYTRFLQRPAIGRALADAREHKYDVIVFKELSRISRDQAEHVEIVSRFTQFGVRVVAINDNLDSARPETLDLLGIHSVMAEMESKRISSRVSSGKKSLARRGVWAGEAPIGYRVNPDTRRLEVDPAFAAVPPLVFRLFTVDGLGALRIAAYLNEHGTRTKNGRLWSRTTVTRVLRNPAYAGDLVYGRTRNTLRRIFDDNGYAKLRGRSLLPTDDWVVVPDAHPPLVSRAEFAAAARVLAARARQNPRRTRHPLTGILVCSRCGSGMVCQKQRQGNQEYRYYACSRAFRFGRSQCSQPNLNAPELEGAMRQLLFERLQPFATAGVRFEAKRPPRGVRDSSSRAGEEALEQALRKAQLGLERLLADPDIPPATFSRLKASYLQTMAGAQAELRRLTVAAERTPEVGRGAATVSQLLARLQSIDPDDLDELRRFFHGLLSTVGVHGYDVTQVALRYAFDLRAGAVAGE